MTSPSIRQDSQRQREQSRIIHHGR